VISAVCSDKGQFRHLRVQIQLGKGSNREGTHRTRSFLFAALGVIAATAFSQEPRQLS
jgi:hypothetical protein